MNSQTTLAIILRRINYGEADRILTVITPNKGKLSLLAKGVRRSKSKLAGGLELFSVTQVSYIDGRSDLKTITSTNLKSYYGNIVTDIQSTMMAYEFMKFIDRLTQEDCEPGYFELLQQALEALHEHVEHRDIVNAWFCSRLLALGGRGINLEQQVDGSAFEEEGRYHFSSEDMGFFSHAAGYFQPKHIKLLRLLSKVSKPSNLLQIADAPKLAHEVVGILLQSLRSHA